jgi:hypothetical protein
MAFDPDKVSPEKLPPRPYITSFKLGGQPLSIDSLFREKSVELKYTNTSFNIDFSAMSFLQQRKLHYYYRLDGLEKEWIHTDRPTGIVYNYLPPGKYTFYVKTQTIDGISNDVMAKLNIVVSAPFWKTSWFFSIIILLLLSIWYFIDRERINKRKSLLNVRSEIANNLHDDISVTLNDINVLSEMARIKAGKNVEQSKDFIAQISEKSSNMIVAMDDMLWSIDPANDSMKNTLQRIKELTSGLQVAHEVDIELIIDNKLEQNEMEMKLRHDFYFLYKDAITFFVRNDSINQVFVNLKDKKSHLLIEIVSNYPLNLADFESNFKRVMHKRIQQLPNNLTFSSDGTQILAVFKIPLN